MSARTLHGWRALCVLLPLITACYGAFTWALSALLLSVLVYSDPSAIAADATTLFDGPMLALVPWMLVGGVISGMVLQGVAHYSSWWTDRLPVMSDVPNAAALIGSALGVAIGVAGATTTRGWVLGGAVFAILAFFAIRLLFRAVAETREHAEEVDRVDDLRAHGTRVRADVEDVLFLDTWIGGQPLFDVTASYESPSGRHTATGRVLSDPAGAPIVGGTVRLWFAGDGSGAENVDMDEDPKSIRDPDAERLYEPPSD